MTADEPLELIERAQLRYELIRHPRTETAVGEARAIGVPADDVAKTLVVLTPEGCVRAVLPASERLDLHKLREALALHGGSVRLATEAELAGRYPEFELGSVPPLGGAHRDRVVVDERLRSHERIVFELGSHERSLRMDTDDLLALTGAEVVDICVG